MDKELKKLNDDDLENVSGGTYGQTRELSEIIGEDPIYLSKILLWKYQIKSKLLLSKENLYWDAISREEMTHDEVLKRISAMKRN